MTAVADIIEVLDTHYPPRLAMDWDSVGLVCGDPADTVTAVLVCIDVTDAVVDEAVARGVELIVAHHPLLMRGVDTVGAHTAKGRLVHRLIRAGCALFTAHTNADVARPGVSDALADALGVIDTAPLQPIPQPSLDKWTVFVPIADANAVSDAMFRAGAGTVGDYSRCRWSVSGTGEFVPGDDANPAVGQRGRVEQVSEDRVEMVAPPARREAVRTALRRVHPYEEPAFDVVSLAPTRADVGLGRIGRLAEPTTLVEFTDLVARSLPTAPWGVRAAGDPESTVAVVAVSGGAGDSLLDDATAAGAHVLVTADLRHHPVDEHLRAGGAAVVDAGHWATEFPWCAQVVDILRAWDESVVASIFTSPTDPFTIHSGR